MDIILTNFILCYSPLLATSLFLWYMLVWLTLFTFDWHLHKLFFLFIIISVDYYFYLSYHDCLMRSWWWCEYLRRCPLDDFNHLLTLESFNRCFPSCSSAIHNRSASSSDNLMALQPHTIIPDRLNLTTMPQSPSVPRNYPHPNGRVFKWTKESGKVNRYIHT